MEFCGHFVDNLDDFFLFDEASLILNNFLFSLNNLEIFVLVWAYVFHLNNYFVEKAESLQVVVLLLDKFRWILSSSLRNLLKFHKQFKFFSSRRFARIVHLVKFFSHGHNFSLFHTFCLNIFVGHEHLLIGLPQKRVQLFQVFLDFLFFLVKLGDFRNIFLDCHF